MSTSSASEVPQVYPCNPCCEVSSPVDAASPQATRVNPYPGFMERMERVSVSLQNAKSKREQINAHPTLPVPHAPNAKNCQKPFKKKPRDYKFGIP